MEQKPKKVKEHLFGDKKLNINTFVPDQKVIYRSLGLPDDYDEYLKNEKGNDALNGK